MTIVTCNCCGTKFNIVPAKIALGAGKFCSENCRNTMRGYRDKVRSALPGTVLEIAARSGVSASAVRHQLTCLRERGEAHISGLAPLPADSRSSRVPSVALVFAAGPGADTAVPLNLRAATSYMMKQRILEAMPASQQRIVELTGLVQSTVFRLVTQLHQEGQCHVQRWCRSKLGAPRAIYKAGPGKDSKCNVQPFTRAEICRRYKRKLERTGQLEEMRAKYAAEERAKTIRKNGDMLVRALFGPLRRAA